MLLPVLQGVATLNYILKFDLFMKIKAIFEKYDEIIL